MRGPTHARNSECADAGEQAEGAANDAASGHAGRGAFGSLGVFFVREGTGVLVVGKQDRDRGIAEAFGGKVIDGCLGSAGRCVDTENCCLFAGHDVAPSMCLLGNRCE
jgi:hypothetical protein